MTISKLIPFRDKNKWGFCTSDKNIVINCVYDDVLLFTEGLAGVKLKDRWLFIDESGQIAIPDSFQGVESFSEGYAVVTNNGHKGVIDRKGDLILPFDFSSLYISHNLIFTYGRTGQGNCYGLWDTSGERL